MFSWRDWVIALCVIRPTNARKLTRSRSRLSRPGWSRSETKQVVFASFFDRAKKKSQGMHYWSQRPTSARISRYNIHTFTIVLYLAMISSSASCVCLLVHPVLIILHVFFSPLFFPFCLFCLPACDDMTFRPLPGKNRSKLKSRHSLHGSKRYALFTHSIRSPLRPRKRSIKSRLESTITFELRFPSYSWLSKAVDCLTFFLPLSCA